jgi:hypothetical protein
MDGKDDNSWVVFLPPSLSRSFYGQSRHHRGEAGRWRNRCRYGRIRLPHALIYHLLQAWELPLYPMELLQ